MTMKDKTTPGKDHKLKSIMTPRSLQGATEERGAAPVVDNCNIFSRRRARSAVPDSSLTVLVKRRPDNDRGQASALKFMSLMISFEARPSSGKIHSTSQGARPQKAMPFR